MDVSGAEFQNQRMLMSNPTINPYSIDEFEDPQNASFHGIHHEVSVESYKPAGERRNNIAGFRLDHDLSDARHAVYYHPAHKRVILGARGTVPSQLRDVFSDGELTIGRFRRTNHYKEAVRKYQEVQDKFGPGQTYHLSGHSLGSHTAQALHHRFPNSTKTSVLFNLPGSVPGLISSGIQNVYQTRTQRKVGRNSITYNNTLDPVSILSRHKSNQRTQKKHYSANPHSLSSWYHYNKY